MISKEMLENWYTPKHVPVVSEDKETVIEINKEVCEMCEGTGITPIYTRTDEGNYVWDGDEPCVCQQRVEE